MLEVQHLSKSFGGVKAADDVTLDFADGSLTAVIGPNGAGKSTFFNLITGALTPNSGGILLDGVDMAGRSPPDIVRRRHRPRLSDREHLPLAHRARDAAVGGDRPPGPRMHTAPALSARRNPRPGGRIADGHAGPRDLLDTLSANLSHGDQKLLDIALALVLEPRVLLLDEPTAGMGPDERWRMIDKVHELWERRRSRSIFIEHDMDIVFKIAPKIGVLCYGRVLAEGTPDADPLNQAVIDAYLGTEDHAEARHEHEPVVRSTASMSTMARARSCSASTSSCGRARRWRCSAATAPGKRPR